MRISVVVPSRLQLNPHVLDELLLDRALMSVRRQTCWADHEWELIVAVDPGKARDVPGRFASPEVTIVEAVTASQASAVNVGMGVATGDVLALLEDDDLWRRDKMAVQLPLIEHPRSFGLVTCNQRELDWSGNYLRTNDFATPSGWVMLKETWKKVGGFNESIRYHVDTEWLGQANAAGVIRLHVVEDGAPERAWLANVGHYSGIHRCSSTEPLVDRFVNPKGGMSTIAAGGEAQKQSLAEHELMARRFGSIPW